MAPAAYAMTNGLDQGRPAWAGGFRRRDGGGDPEVHGSGPTSLPQRGPHDPLCETRGPDAGPAKPRPSDGHTVRRRRQLLEYAEGHRGVPRSRKGEWVPQTFRGA